MNSARAAMARSHRRASIKSAGDLNCNGSFNASDIEPFPVALFDPGIHATHYPDFDIDVTDINGHRASDALDIEPLLGLLFGS